LRLTRHARRSLAAHPVAASVSGGSGLGAGRERRELTRWSTVGMHEFDVQMEGDRVVTLGLIVCRMPSQSSRGTGSETFGS
jgi:hypothetical protein